MKYEALKTALKKMECHRSTSSRNHINAYSTKTYQKGRPPTKLELQLTMSLGIKKIIIIFYRKNTIKKKNMLVNSITVLMGSVMISKESLED